ncbi:RING/U-box superfamily protein, partial [Striga asiatica]
MTSLLFSSHKLRSSGGATGDASVATGDSRLISSSSASRAGAFLDEKYAWLNLAPMDLMWKVEKKAIAAFANPREQLHYKIRRLYYKVASQRPNPRQAELSPPPKFQRAAAENPPCRCEKTHNKASSNHYFGRQRQRMGGGRRMHRRERRQTLGIQALLFLSQPSLKISPS